MSGENFYSAFSKNNDSDVVVGAIEWVEHHKLASVAIGAAIVGGGAAAKFIPELIGGGATRAESALASTKLLDDAVDLRSAMTEIAKKHGLEIPPPVDRAEAIRNSSTEFDLSRALNCAISIPPLTRPIPGLNELRGLLP